MPRRVLATRYVTPLREGGSLPGLVEADDDGLYVVKFRGAGQGLKALVAELVVGQLGAAVGLPSPRAGAGRDQSGAGPHRARPRGQRPGHRERRPEFRDRLPAWRARLQPGGGLPAEAAFAAGVVWFDALMTNVDRTPRNPNLLVWHRRTWLIDHGAALYQRHSERDFVARAREPFPMIADHVLLPVAGPIAAADERLAPEFTEARIGAAVEEVPDDWLGEDPQRERRIVSALPAGSSRGAPRICAGGRASPWRVSRFSTR